MRKVVECRFAAEFGEMEAELKKLHDFGLLSERSLDLFGIIRERVISQDLDFLTQLMSRTPWYKELRSTLLRLYPELRSIDELSEEEAQYLMKRLSSKKLSRVSMLVGDMAFLNVANDRGRHDQGDYLLVSVGQYFNDVFSRTGEYIRVSRTGGDEFVCFMVDVPHSFALSLANEFLDRLGGIEVPNLQVYGLKPKMDFGIAAFSETCRVLLEVLESGVELPKPRLAFLIDTFVLIADIRSSIAKSLDRIPLLMLLREELHPDLYQRVKSLLKKGAFGIPEESLDELTRLSQEDSSAYERAVLDFVLDNVHHGGGRDVIDGIVVNKALEPWEKVPLWRRLIDVF